MNLLRVIGAPHSGLFVSRGKRRATFPAVFMMFFKENWALLGLSLLGLLDFINSFIYLFMKFESKVGLKAVCFGWL